MKNAPLAFALVGALLASSAYAQELPPGVSVTQAPVAVSVDADGTATVTLKNGSLYRGALIERIQGDHVTLKTATGEVKTFLWADLAPAAAPAPVAPSPPAKPLEAPGVLVTLTGDEGVHLERVTGTESGGAWITMQSNSSGGSWGSGWAGQGRGGMAVLYGPVCQAPCNVRVDSSYVYRVAGPGYVATRTFQVSGDAVRVDAHMGSMAQRVLGWVAFGAGLAVGATGLVGGWICSAIPNCTSTGWFIAGGVGLAAAVGGLVMVLTSGSSVELDGQPV
ncbi:MAG TPA: hypothetical protein VF316_09640, partial [Polyangiaceae bacterium]